MAATLTQVADSQGSMFGGTTVVTYDVVPDTSFPSGGYAITPANVGLRKITGVNFIAGIAANLGYVPVWDRVNGKFTIFLSSTGAEVTGNLSTLSFRLQFLGNE